MNDEIVETIQKAIETPELGQKPSIGRIVHYVHHDEDLPAIITQVEDNEEVNLVVFDVYHPHGTIVFFSVEHSELENDNGTWHWPERV